MEKGQSHAQLCRGEGLKITRYPRGREAGRGRDVPGLAVWHRATVREPALWGSSGSGRAAVLLFHAFAAAGYVGDSREFVAQAQGGGGWGGGEGEGCVVIGCLLLYGERYYV